jgi:predicted dehydrogenase
MVVSKNITRRSFISKSTKTAAGIAAASAVVSNTVMGANDRINIAVLGLRSRGGEHCREFSKIPNVRIKTICDPDENFFMARAAQINELTGKSPGTEFDLRHVLDDKEIDAISIATPDHWHALATIWGCQAGKHVYVEKPTSHNMWEGRKMIEAARKYNRVVSAGMQNRSLNGPNSAIKFLHEGGIGDVYMARALCFKPRDSIGKKQNAPVPEGVHYDLWLGPAPWRPFNPNRFHYNWHWFWDYGMPDMGNQGPHQMDIARWGLGKEVFPRKIKSAGGYFAFDSDQETPNTQSTIYEYDDGKILQFETRGLYTNDENGIRIGNLFFGSEGWMHLNGNDWKTYLGRENTPGPSFSSKDQDAADPANLAGAASLPHFINFIDAVKSGNWMDLNADILEGHRSTSMVHLGNISYRTGRELIFDSHAEKFVGDEQANGYLTRNYRHPYVVPDEV